MIWSLLIVLSLLCSCVKPIEDLASLRAENLAKDREAFYGDLLLEDEELTLGQAVQLALCQNLSVRMQRWQQKIQEELTTAETLTMLPSLSYIGAYEHRFNEPGVSNVARSVDKTTRRWNLGIAWRTLDFGVGFYRARQAVKQEQVIDQQQLRERQNLVRDVVEQFWRAITLKRSADDAKDLVIRAEKRQKVLQAQVEDQVLSAVIGLDAEQQIIDMQMRLNAYEQEYKQAKTSLSSLMGLAPGTSYTLAESDMKDLEPFDLDIIALEKEALLNRPELVEQDIQEKIDADQVRASIVRMFPSVDLYSEFHGDDNRFLLNNNWLLVGAEVVYDLLSLPENIYRMKSDQAKKRQTRENRWMLSVGIISQVHLAYLQVLDSKMQYELAKELFETRDRLFFHAEREKESGQMHAAEVLDWEIQRMLAKADALRAYSAYQFALESLANSVGHPLKFSALHVDKEWMNRIRKKSVQTYLEPTAHSVSPSSNGLR